jgi:hypothetical protein
MKLDGRHCGSERLEEPRYYSQLSAVEPVAMGVGGPEDGVGLFLRNSDIHLPVSRRSLSSASSPVSNR